MIITKMCEKKSERDKLWMYETLMLLLLLFLLRYFKFICKLIIIIIVIIFTLFLELKTN